MSSGPDPTPLAGRRVLLTGACGGIGRALAAGLARAGARLAVTDVDAEALAGLAAGLPGEDHITHAGHLRGVDFVQTLVGSCVERLGGLDVLVHTAAVLRRQPVDQVTEAAWDEQHDVNLKSTFFLARAVAEDQRRRGTAGSLVLYSSQAFWTGGYGASVVYASTKGGVTSLVRGLARTYGPDGIRVNAIAPGIVDTPMLRTQSTQDSIDAVVAATPLGRIADPAEMMGPTLFLASDASSFVTGTVLNVSGGWLAY
jgi:NAD(P)-dependent dehydrogenase (short-subunit alcohol dehydrogenase family)